jgi:hypothetical protein
MPVAIPLSDHISAPVMRTPLSAPSDADKLFWLKTTTSRALLLGDYIFAQNTYIKVLSAEAPGQT